jgi:hypothetical protein
MVSGGEESGGRMLMMRQIMTARKLNKVERRG